MKDYILRATAAHNQIRIFVATTKYLVEEARSLHQTTPVATAALGRLLTAGAIMGAMMKNDKDLLTLQIKGSGPIEGIVVTADSKANVKGYVYNPIVELPPNEKGKLDVSGALGLGVLTIIKDIGLKEPYIGQTHLVTGEIADDLTYYFATSEQVPSVVALGVLVDRDYSVKQSGGFILQLLPDADEALIDQLEANIAGITSITSLFEAGKTPEDLLKMVLGDLEVTIHEQIETKFQCNCSKERIEKVLISVGKKEMRQMIEEDESIELNCHFCSKKYQFNREELGNILNNL
ncbi:MAG: Hsp33 family molecular chaperone HslO [Vallitaleaceae bacterium]|nr:Hsp33 family molecular chaperone HslO [Vallitaleaceae bacterium]